MDVITCVPTQTDPSAAVVIRDIFSIVMAKPAEVGFFFFIIIIIIIIILFLNMFVNVVALVVVGGGAAVK